MDKSFLTEKDFRVLLNANKENEHLEFKTAKNSFSFDSGKHSVCGYAVALANEGGGKLILGVKDKRPRIVEGTRAFKDIAKLEKDLYRKIRRRIDVQELLYQTKRVLIINIPSRPIGEAIEFDGQYLMRVQDELVSMSPDKIKEIVNESVYDYSSKPIQGLKYEELDPLGIKELRRLLLKSNRVNKEVNDLTDRQLLQDLGLVDKKNITVGALVLLGSRSIIKQFLPYSEIRYGYKSDEKEIRNQDSVIFDEGYLLYHQKLWEKINSRNLSLHIPRGLTLIEKKVFDEETIREAINNAIIHRDYSETETTLVIQTPYKLTITSPGGFPKGITIDNIADTTKTRNKLIADVLYKCEFVEQFGNGVNLMIKNQLSLGKSPPDYSSTDKYRVSLCIDGDIKDIEFAKYVINVGEKLGLDLNDEQLRLLYEIKEHDKSSRPDLVNSLLEIGIIEKKGTNKFILSKQYYTYINKPGIYTRRRGLDKETNKQLIVKHLEHHGKGYIQDFVEALKNVPQKTINSYLRELKDDGFIELIGKPTSWSGPKRAYWKLAK